MVDCSAVATDLAMLRHHVDAMKAANTAQHFEAAWRGILEESYSCFEKIKGLCKDHPRLKPWMDKRKDLTRSDPLLSYIYNARNAKTHGLNMAHRWHGPTLIVGNFVEGPPTSNNFAVTGLGAYYEPPSMYLVDAINFGKTYPVPKEHLGKPIIFPTPLALAELVCAYFTQAVLELADLQ